MPQLGDNVSVALALGGRETNLYPRATIYDSDDNLLDTLDLDHVSAGYYSNTTYTMPANEDFVLINYNVYTDAGHTSLSGDYQQVAEVVYLEPASAGSASVTAQEVVALVVSDTNDVPNNEVDQLDIYQGQDKSFAIRLIDANGEPFDLGTMTEITARFVKTTSGILAKTLTGGAIALNGDSAVGKFTITLSDTDTATLKTGAHLRFELYVDLGTDRHVIQSPRLLNVRATIS
jgi:hypothetical protein